MASKWPARIAGGAAGLANGLFGGGGGMVFLPILSRWGGLKSRQLYATCVAVIFPVCAVSAAIYLWRGGMNWASALPYLVGGLLGGLAGRKALRQSVHQSFEVDLRRLSLLRGGEVSAVTDWLLPLSLRAGGCGDLRVGRGRRNAAAVGDDTVFRRGPANGPGHQPAVFPAHSHFRPAVPLAEGISGYTHMEGRRPRGCPDGTCRSMDRHSGGCGPAAPPLRYLPAALRSFADFPQRIIKPPAAEYSRRGVIRFI